MTTSEKIAKNSALIGWLICGLGAVFYCYEYLLRIAPSVMTTDLMHSFNLHAETLTALISLYYLAYSPMQAVVGMANDTFGPRKILVFAIAICVIGSYLFSTTQSVYVAGFARFLIGFGSSFAFVSVLKLATIWLPASRFAFVAGLATALGMVGGMFGNTGLTMLVNHNGWRHTLDLGTILGIILIPILWFGIRDRNPRVPASMQVKPAIQYKETFKGFWQIVKTPQMWICGAIGSMLYLSLSGFSETLGNQYFHIAYGYSIVQASSVVSMIYFGWLIGGPVVGLFSDRMRLRRLPLTIGAIGAAIVFSIVLFLHPASIITVYIMMFLFGTFCSAENICFAVGRENASNKVAGTAVAFINLLVMLGGMIFQPLVGKLLDMQWHGAIQNGIRYYSAHDYQLAFSFIPIGLVVGALLTFILRETHARVRDLEQIDRSSKPVYE